MARDRERPIRDITHKLDYSNLETDARKVLATGENLEREVRDNEGHIYLMRFRPYRIPAGYVGGVVVTFIDLTPIKHAETALRKSEQRLAEELNVMRVLHSTAMAITSGASLQSALDEFLGEALKLTGADFGTIQLLDDDSQVLKILASRGFGGEFLRVFESIGMSEDTACARAIRTRKTCLMEEVAQDPGFDPYREVIAHAGYNSVQSEPLITKDGEAVGVLSVHFRAPRHFSDRDRQLGGLLASQAANFISGRLQQDRLSSVNETLRHRTVELETARDQLARQAEDLRIQDQNREAFLAALGHELRNPMAAIKNSLEVLSPMDDKSMRAVGILERQVARMGRLINDMLDVTRINRGSMRLYITRFDLKECAVAAVEAVRGQAHTKGLELETELPPEPILVEGDPERISQVLDNLLQNALKFTDRGRITVTVRRSAKEAVVAVRDTGIGVEPKRIASIFEASTKVESITGSGLGMGLSLVKRLVELHRGSVTFRSEGRDRGSEVTFMIPLLSSAAPQDAAGDGQLTSKRILIIDDNGDAADALGLLLENLGYQVMVAYNGESALETARQQPPQVAFVDLTMPGMSGSEVARRLRQLFTPAELILVALSGYLPSHPSAQEDAPFEHYLLKPATGEDIVNLLSSL